MNTITSYRIVGTSTYISDFISRKQAQEVHEKEVEKYKSWGSSTADEIKIESKENGYANYHSYTDVHPYEIVRVISDKTIEVRAMEYKLLNANELDFHVGGFSAHCSNQRVQKYEYVRNENNPVIRIRLRKDRNFWYKTMKFCLSETPYKFHDYNF